jgi:hypothetical protein
LLVPDSHAPHRRLQLGTAVLLMPGQSKLVAAIA